MEHVPIAQKECRTFWPYDFKYGIFQSIWFKQLYMYCNLGEFVNVVCVWVTEIDPIAIPDRVRFPCFYLNSKYFVIRPSIFFSLWTVMFLWCVNKPPSKQRFFCETIASPILLVNLPETNSIVYRFKIKLFCLILSNKIIRYTIFVLFLNWL